MRIPKLSDIINRALEDRGDATQAHDDATVQQLDRLIKNLYSGQKQRWADDGTLHVRSANTAGAEYTVTAHACDCPARVAHCTHRRLYDLLVSMFEEECVSADQDAEPRDVWPRVAAARTLIWTRGL